MVLVDDDLNELEWVTLEPGDEPSVLTAEFRDFFGGCEKCLGFTQARKLNLDHSEPDASVFCTHWCHRVASHA